jgi:GDPmannose 4,6-dehydratase
MNKKKVLIFNINQEKGAYLAKYLLKKKYVVHGVCRDKKLKNLKDLDLQEKIRTYIFLKFDKKKLSNLLKKNFDEIYFLDQQITKKNLELYNSEISPVKLILDYIVLQKGKKTKFLYEGSSKMYGNINYKKKVIIKSNQKPTSFFGLSKLINYEIIKSYRQMFNIPICLVIILNYEPFTISGKLQKILNSKKIEDFIIMPNNKILLKNI